MPVSALNPAFGIEITVPEPVYLNGKTNIRITLANITTPVSGIEFELKFDSAFLMPVITENANDEMNAFIKASPLNGWEQICIYNKDTTSYCLRFSAPDGAKDENTLVKTGSDLVIEIPFTAKAEGNPALAVSDSSIIATDKDLNLISGTGTTKTFSIINSDKIRLAETSTLKQYTVGENVYLTGIKENTPVSELLKNFINTNLKITDYKGNTVTDGICMTGQKVCLYSGDKLLDSVILVIKGDIDRDGTVSSTDCLLIKKYCLKNTTFDEVQLQAAHIGEDEEISSITYLLVKRHVIGTFNLYE